MALSPDLIGFVKESLHRGLPRADVEQVLLRAGWPAEQVRRALSSFADVEFAIPVPRPVPSVSARDAFMYVVMFATLILSGYNLGDLLPFRCSCTSPGSSVGPFDVSPQSEHRKYDD